MSWIGSPRVPFSEIGMTQEKLDLMKELAENNEYWRNASSFIRAVANRKLSSLSLRQRNWIYEIDASLGDELNKKIAKELFDEGT